MEVIRSAAAMQERARAIRARGGAIGFVPTMGFLHEGHRSLMRIARSHGPSSDRTVVVSIFVNPLQFGPNEDLARYPRDPDGDARQCAEEGVDLLFMPETLYLGDHATTVKVARLTSGLCGASRPGHFDGVTTVVARLFGLVAPTFSVFGEKDFQQLAVIRKMVDDLAMGIEIVGGPLVRDAGGLALSSRNKYLSSADRPRALTLHRSLQVIRELADAGQRDPARLVMEGRKHLDVDRFDYLEVVDARTLAWPTAGTTEARALVAAFFGTTRLIDNVAVPWT